jgi:hypothetical protein
VVVSNVCGSATSNPATLTVTCPAYVSADLDHDCDVDADDLTFFKSCETGTAVPATSGCSDSDFDQDEDVDQSDYGILQRCYSGPHNPADPNCGS